MRHRTPGMVRYMAGLRSAESKGVAAGQDARFTEHDNPYRQYEHRTSWLEGFRRSRATLATETGHEAR